MDNANTVPGVSDEPTCGQVCLSHAVVVPGKVPAVHCGILVQVPGGITGRALTDNPQPLIFPSCNPQRFKSYCSQALIIGACR